MKINYPLLALAIGAFGIGTTEFSPMGLLPVIARGVDVSIPAAGMLISAYAVGVMVGAPLMTLLLSHRARRSALIFLMAIFTLGNVLSAIAPDYMTLMLSRILTSLNHGAFFGLGSVVAASVVPKHKQASAVATMFMGLTLANIGGVPAATWLGETIGRHYVTGLGLSMEDTEEGKLSQFLVAANRIAFIDPANGNETPMFVAQGNQIFMNEVFLKYLTAPTITSGGNPPVFSLTPDGRLTAKNADISGNVNANSGTLNNVTINENCRVLGKLSANQIEGDLVKTVGKAFPRDSRAPERWPSGTITVRVYDDQPFDRQIVIPAVAFSGARHERENSDTYSSCRLIVKKNGAEIYNRTALDNTLIYTGVIDMPAGSGVMTLEFSVSAWWVNGWYPTASISDLLVVVMKKATAGITIS